MKVGMYNRWLATLGGGEKHSLTIAQYLSQNHDVHVITHKPVPADEISHRLNLDLSRVCIDVIPSRSALEVTPLTSEYDLFINASYMDFIPSKAPHSAAVIYFPAAPGAGGNARLRYRLGWALKRWFMVPTLSEGFERFRTGSSNLRQLEVGFPLRFKLPPSSEAYQVSFQLASLHPAIGEVRLVLDGQIVEVIRFSTLDESRPITLNVPASPNRLHDLSFEAPGLDHSLSRAARLALSPLVVNTPRFKSFHSILGGALGEYGARFQLLPLPHSDLHDAIDSYDALWAISEYTRRWIKTYWKRDSAVLYPPIDIENFSPAPKKNQVLSVGRFFAGGHNKKHLEMVKAFKGLVDGGLKDWELHLVGGSTPGNLHEKYLAEIISEAANYPIKVHPDMAYPDLLKLYNESAIYWHASGYGEDEARDPVRFEHFGITTVEGMAAGCVPVVIAKGGQPEIVRHGENGYLWSTLDELKQFTWNLAVNPSLRQLLAASALADSHKYSSQNFQNNLKEQLGAIGVS